MCMHMSASVHVARVVHIGTDGSGSMCIARKTQTYKGRDERERGAHSPDVKPTRLLWGSGIAHTPSEPPASIRPIAMRSVGLAGRLWLQTPQHMRGAHLHVYLRASPRRPKTTSPLPTPRVILARKTWWLGLGVIGEVLGCVGL